MIPKNHLRQGKSRKGYASDFTFPWNRDSVNSSISDQPPVGLVAGWGRFPIEVAQKIIASGGRVCCVAITGHASSELESICDHVKWMGVGKIGGHIRYFRSLGVKEVTMAGKLFKADILFSGSLWLRHFPDWCAIKTFAPHLLLNRNRNASDDNLLLAVTRAYQGGDMEVCAATDFAPELLVEQGNLTGRPIGHQASADIRAGWRIAKTMGGLDIGQTITIKDCTVIAVEAIEGTDACIQRTGELCKRGGWTLVKVSKPDQDMRFDVPTIGPQTVQNVSDAGGKVIAIEAGKTILVDRENTLALARKSGIAIVAVDDAEMLSESSPGTVRRVA